MSAVPTSRGHGVARGLVALAVLAAAAGGVAVPTSGDAVAGPRGAAADPASQRQTGLGEAAGRPTPVVRGGSAAQRVPSPPTARRESTSGLLRSRTSRPRDVLSPGAAAGGCFLEYGDGGQCLPLRPPQGAGHAGHGSHGTPVAWTCDLVRLTFPDGVVLRGAEDPLGLDDDDDGTGCGPSDG